MPVKKGTPIQSIYSKNQNGIPQQSFQVNHNKPRANKIILRLTCQFCMPITVTDMLACMRIQRMYVYVTIDSMIRFHINRFSHRLYLCSFKFLSLASRLNLPPLENISLRFISSRDWKRQRFTPCSLFCAVPGIWTPWTGSFSILLRVKSLPFQILESWKR